MMELLLDGITYDLNMSFSAVLKFADRHNVSVVDLIANPYNADNAALLLQLLHDGAGGMELTFSEFQGVVGNGTESIKSALDAAVCYARKLVEIEPSGNHAAQNADNIPDLSGMKTEYIVASCALITGIDARTFEWMTMKSIVKMMECIITMKSAGSSGSGAGGNSEKTTFHKLSPDNVKSMYAGIM